MLRYFPILILAFALSATAQDTAPLRRTSEFIGACGAQSDIDRVVIGMRGHAPIIGFNRFAGTRDGKRIFKATYFTANSARNEWFLVFVDRLADAERSPTDKVCIQAGGSAMELIDHAAYGAAFENTINISGNDIPQGFIHWKSNERARKKYAELQANLDRAPDGPNPNLKQVLGFTFDFRDEETACAAAKAHWHADYCTTYVRRMFDDGDLGRDFPAMQARGIDPKGDYLFTFLVRADGNRVTLLISNAKGGTVRWLSGRDLAMLADPSAPSIRAEPVQPRQAAPSAPEANAIAPGTYAVEGRNPNGSLYRGTVAISAQGGGRYLFR